eukprot:sb/3473458/
MGEKLKVNQLCINTAIVYMHRFFMCHSFTVFHRTKIAKACIFLSAKVEEQPRRLEHVINTAHYILTYNTQGGYKPLEVQSEAYKREVEELIRNETIILQTLVTVDTTILPHLTTNTLFQAYKREVEELIRNETIILQTLGNYSSLLVTGY